LQLGYQDQQFLSAQGFHVFKGTHGRNLAQILWGCKTQPLFNYRCCFSEGK
jgi:hypothetical protein